jgi:hypothetical protein
MITPLLYARVGKTFHRFGKQVKKDDVKDVVDAIKKLNEGIRFIFSLP